MVPFSLQGKNIVVTGASSGIGRQCAISCSLMGANVILLGRNEERLNNALSEAREAGTPAQKHQAFLIDLLSYDDVEEVIKKAVAETGPVNGLVNAAGVSTILPLKAVSVSKMDEYFRNNVYTAYNLARIVTKSAVMSPDGGSMIFLSSVMGEVGESGRSLYGMTKSALVGATKSLAVELAAKKIRVNCISPGVVVTPMSGKSIYSQSNDTLEKVKNLHPLGFGLPDDVASSCVFLLSDASRWITGINLIVDGGYTAR